MPFSCLCAVPYDVNILLPEFIGVAGEVDITRLTCVAHAIAQAVDQSEAGLIVASRRLGLFVETCSSLEISNFVFPIARAHASRDLPVHKYARPGIELAEQFRISYLDWMFQLAATYNNFVHRRFLLPHRDCTTQQRIPRGRRRMPFAIRISADNRAPVRTIKRFTRPRQIHISSFAGPAVTSRINHLQIAAIPR